MAERKVLSAEQASAVAAVQAFLVDASCAVFILKGYAGTGKTTTVRALLPLLDAHGKRAYLMSPTGRAAAVLTAKTGHEATTIHRAIYTFVDRAAPSSENYQLCFSLRTLPHPEESVVIVDEASMVSSHKTSSPLVHFGSDVLLSDLLTFVSPDKGGKVIFVGDPGQLPPVGETSSAALDEDYFQRCGLSTASVTLTTVLRQDAASAIVRNAMLVRSLLLSQQRSELCFEQKEGEVEELSPEAVIENFVARHPRPTLGGSVVICYTNKSAAHYNHALRQRYFPDASSPQVGDVVQVVSNNYHYNLYNGDFAQLVAVASTVETLSAPLWKKRGNENERVPVSLLFRAVTLRTAAGQHIKCKIIESLLPSSLPSLTADEVQALYVNFMIRHKGKDEDTLFEMMEDKYLNAVQVKYGYALTCHKAQGGEWDTVYVDYRGRTALDTPSLQWIYTATTRAARCLYGVALPTITPFDRLHFEQIKRTTRPGEGALSGLVDVGPVPLLPGANAARRAKYQSIAQALENEGMTIFAVRALQYKDRYTITTPSGYHDYDCTYNAAGLFTRYAPLVASADDAVVLRALASECAYRYAVAYHPSLPSLATLYHRLLTACDDVGVVITGIMPRDKQYQVVFHLRTSGQFAAITFFYDKSGAISYGAPTSDVGADDEKLIALINKLQ